MDAIRPLGAAGYFYEAPRWRADRWWVSDQRGGVVRSFAPDGSDRIELRLDDHPSGLGWLPDGSLLVVSMQQRCVLRLTPGASEPRVHADLRALTRPLEGICNDMVVDPDGNAYVGFDPDFFRYGPDCADGLILGIAPDGTARVAARGLKFPNGMVIDSQHRLVVAETQGERLSGFAIHDDGSLGEGFTWADVSTKQDRRAVREPPLPVTPFGLDGCAIDAEDHIWAADWRSGCYRIAPGGAIVDAVFLPGGLNTWACAIGGADGHDLLLCGANTDTQNRMTAAASRLFVTRVAVPAAW